MNLFEVANFYIDRIVNSSPKNSLNVVDQSRVKAMLLDKNTIGTISMCTTQSELLEHEIYLVDTIENQQRDVMRHLKCLVYVKPTDETIGLLVQELQNPKYGEYQIFFNNTVTKSQLERLAECDDLEVVNKVEEIFQDYQILNEDLFSLDMAASRLFSNHLVWDPHGLEDVTHGLVSLLLSLKVKPVIRYEAASRLSAKLGKEILYEIDKNEKILFDFPPVDSPPQLFILDRKNDPLTPLLQPWTYQSMINEYIGIKRNVVDLSKVPDLDPTLKQVVLSSKQDAFFHDTMYLNFGELGDKVKQYVSNYKNKTNSNSQINTIEDIKRFIEKFPEFKKLSGNVSKHMAIVGELDRQLQMKRIWDISEVEQNISVHADDSQDHQDLLKIMADPQIDSFYKMKLACINSLRSNNSTRISEIANALKQAVSPEDFNFYHQFNSLFNNGANRKAAGNEKEDLISELTKKFNHKGAHKADNVYMQHEPALSILLSEISRNKVSEEKYPSLGNANIRNAPQDVIIFFVGGVTFEEARVVHQFNEVFRKDGRRIRVVLGGTTVVSTSDYIKSCQDSGRQNTELNDLLL
ncbi:LAFE_0C05578g1_1 [Lachancea fermentati]|uniref:LAFE_0C05578g1_1 n=1 Tax=Lachancea fermentati TaxID=4955 RepID=A0A1G4M9K1_LACFM|nr:LAFE_0C05578g1_1 [Lachancea fermentati]